MAVTETLALHDGVSDPARKMAAAIRSVDAALGKVRKGTERVGAAAKKAEPPTKKLGGKDALGAIAGGRIATGLVTAAAGIAVIGSLLVKAATFAIDMTKRVLELGAAFLQAVGSAQSARSAAEKMLNAITGNQGPAALIALDKLSLKLGLSLEEGRDQFLGFVKAGKSAGESAALLKMRSDLIAVTGSAEEADKALKPVLDAPSGKATSDALARVGKEAGVAGNGVAAMNKSMSTFEGFTNRLKNAPARIFDQIAKSGAGEQLDRIGAAAGKALDSFLESPEAAQLFEAIGEAISTVLAGIEKAVPLVAPFLEGFAAGLEPIISALEPIGDAISEAFGDDKTEQMKTAEKVGRLLGKAFAIIGIAIAAVAVAGGVLVASLLAALVLPQMLGEAIGDLAIAAKAKFDELVDGAKAMASSVIEGIKSGIKNGTGAVADAMRDLATSAKNAFKKALGISSPSKVFAMLGGNVSAGLEKGVAAGEQRVAQATSGLAGAAIGGAVSGAGAGAGAGGNVELTINVSAQPGATRQDGEALAAGLAPTIRRELTALLSGRSLELAGAT